ncbi:MAG: ATP-binding protein [Candidatus Saccharimonadales bacterium]|jgi:PAS domain S-box-containing protein
MQPDITSQPISANTSEDKVSRYFNFIITTVATLFILILVVGLATNNRSVTLDLRFNFYAILSFGAFAANTIAFILIARLKERTDVLKWFSVFLMSISAWALAETMVRLSATPATALFWDHFTSFGSVFFPVALYMFVLTYIRSKHFLSSFVLPMLIPAAALFVFTDTLTNLIKVYRVSSVQSTAWGFVAKTGSLYIVIATWVFILSLISILLLIKFYRQTIEPSLRLQTKLYIIALIIPLIGGGVTDGLLATLNINVVPTLAVTLLAVTGVIISYGIIKHQLFRFTPSLIAAQILDTISEAVIGVTPEMYLSYANAGAERMLGYSTKELINRKLFDLFADKWTPEQLQKKLLEPLTHQDSYAIDSINILTTAGNSITTKLSISKINVGLQTDGYLMVLTDITAIAQSQTLIEIKVKERTHQFNEEHARLQSAINSLDVGLLMTFHDNQTISYNTMLQHMFGIYKVSETTSEVQTEVTLDTIENKLLKYNFDLNKAIEKCQYTGKYFNISEITYENRILSIYGAPIRIHSNTIIGTVILFSDITESKIMERSKDEFFSIASHELRTPLTGIRGNSSMILSYYQQILDDPQLKEMIEDIHSSSVRLIAIVNDFLDVSRLEQGKVKFAYTPVSVEKIIENVAYEMRAVLTEKKIYLKVDKLTLGSLPLVWADENRLKQVVYNLVGNASKFTEEGGISISAKLSDTKDYIKVLVTDTGRGMSSDSQQLLFHKFQQASSSLLTRDTTRGTGLGLYISKMIIENMGGHIALEYSEPNKGSTFSFTLPVATPTQLVSISRRLNN